MKFGPGIIVISIYDSNLSYVVISFIIIQYIVKLLFSYMWICTLWMTKHLNMSHYVIGNLILCLQGNPRKPIRKTVTIYT